MWLAKQFVPICHFKLRNEEIHSKLFQKSRDIAIEDSGLQRSELLSLEPVAVGTSDEESMHSYKGRLAHAHSISFQHLSEYLIELILKRIVQTHKSHDSSRYDYQALEMLTFLHDLRCLQFPHDRKLGIMGFEFRNIRTWCPECIKDMQGAGSEVYEKKIWRFDVLKICAKHGTPLAIRCPHKKCNRKQPLFHPIIRPGYCSWCGNSLGTRIRPPSEEILSRIPKYDRYQTNPIPMGGALTKHLWEQEFIFFGLDKDYSSSLAKPQRDTEFTQIDIKWQYWIAKNIEELITQGSHIPSYLLTERRVHKIYAKYINLAYDGNVDKFAQRIKLHKADLWAWYENLKTPTFEQILHICQFIEISFFDFLKGTFLAPIISSLTTPTNLKKIQYKLERALSPDNVVPPSFRESVISTGHDVSLLYRNFKELCNALICRDKSLKEDHTIKKLRANCRDVRKATIECVQYYRYPSLYTVKEHLSRPNILNDKRVHTYWCEILKMLDLEVCEGATYYDLFAQDCWMRNHYED